MSLSTVLFDRPTSFFRASGRFLLTWINFDMAAFSVNIELFNKRVLKLYDFWAVIMRCIYF